MSRSARLLIGAVILGVIVAAWVWSRSGASRTVMDLVDQFPSSRRGQNPDQYEVIDATINGDTRRAIFFKNAGRVGFELTVPEDAWLELSVGMLDKANTIPGDGVGFWIYVVPLGPDGQPAVEPDGRTRSEELLSLAVNPFGNPGDRSWHDLTLDLSSHAGKRVEVRFVTRHSPPGAKAEGEAGAGDFFVIGRPRIVVN